MGLWRAVAVLEVLGEVLGRFWGGFGVVLGRFWGGFGEVLGRFWGGFGVVLGKFWGGFGEVLGRFLGWFERGGGRGCRSLRAFGQGFRTPSSARWVSRLLPADLKP